MTQTKNIQTNQTTNLKNQIIAARRRLNTLWEAEGCTSPKVLAAAGKLDALCNKYQRLVQQSIRKDDT